MAKSQSAKKVEILSSFTDILYLTDKKDVAPSIRELFAEKKLSHLLMPVDRFADIDHRLDLIGTVIMDVIDAALPRPRKLAQIIEQLEQHHIGVILLCERTNNTDHSSETLISEDDHPGLDTAVDIDELWVRISVNLAYRKKSSGMVVKPAGPPKNSIKRAGNYLAEQFSITESLVENLSEQLRLAGLVQRDFLPDQLPNTDNLKWSTVFLPAEWVSGDIYDIARLDEKRIGFYVADAVGHSMPAALLTMFIKQALVMRETFGNEYRVFSPSEVMINLNQKMTGQKLSGYQFATSCYCLLDTETLELTFARAGHPYPILIRQNEPLRQLEIRGSLLGIFEQTYYMQDSVTLEPGDKLVLYSDGADPLVGSFDDNKGFIYTDAFRELAKLNVNDMCQGITDLAKTTHVNPGEIDDITVVALEVS